MTLTKAIEAAREALKNCAEDLSRFTDSAGLKMQSYGENKAEQALAALPDKPMTEDELLGLLLTLSVADKEPFLWKETAQEIIRALKAANVLYVAE